MTPSTVPAQTKEVPLDHGYFKRIKRGLDGALDRALKRPVDLKAAPMVILSDLHKGTRDAADDFQRCEPAYCAALGYYLEAGYHLYVLGDAEELWENDAGPVLKAYPEVLELEAEFHKAGRYHRFWGNHDDKWSHDGPLDDHLRKCFSTGPSLDVHEAMLLSVRSAEGTDGQLFLVHGHQGTLDSDLFRGIARPVVRYGWRRVQRWTGYTGVTPAQDFALRAKHDRAMLEWAGKRPERPVMIAGHTHRPVFWTDKPAVPVYRSTDVVRKELDSDGVDPADVPDLRAELEFGLGFERNPKATFEIKPPCYFNTGCCCFGDGDVTGLEITDRVIRLVRWPDDADAPVPKCLAEEPLDRILAAVATYTAEPAALEVAVSRERLGPDAETETSLTPAE